MVSNHIQCTDRLSDSSNRRNHDLSETYDDKLEQQHQIFEITKQLVRITGVDPDTQLLRTAKFDMDFHINVPERRAIFILCTSIFARGNYERCPLYLFINPENLQDVQSVPSDSSIVSLRFRMTQSPSFVAPNRPLCVKSRYKGVLHALKTFASVRDLTISFRGLITTETRDQLRSIPSIFSSCRFTTDSNHGSLQPLYHGIGGKIEDPSRIYVEPTSNASIEETVEDLLPPCNEEHSPQNPRHLVGSSGMYY